MNSLVVLFSVLAVAAAKPSGLFDAGLVTAYSPALLAAPAAVSHQSRIDIKSSPAIVAKAVAPIIAEPAIVAPAPIAYAAPIAYTAPAAVSHQSRIDIKTSPAYVQTYAAPLAYHAPLAVAPAVLKPEFAPIVAAPAVPLDTPEVIAARAAHFEAKALAGAHLIHKRSAPFYSAPVFHSYAHAPLSYAAPFTYSHAAPLTYSHAPIAYSTPLITKAYGIHPW